MALQPPIPRASEIKAVIAKPGFFASPSDPNRTSCQKLAISFALETSSTSYTPMRVEVPSFCFSAGGHAWQPLWMAPPRGNLAKARMRGAQLEESHHRHAG